MASYNIEALMRMNDELERQELLQAQREERILQLPIDELEDFPWEKHRFKAADGNRLKELEESIRAYGIINPLIVRLLPTGSYQIVAGHNRRTAARNVGYDTVPCILADLPEDDDALGVLTTDNMKNRELLPSERGWGYRDLMEIQGRRGARAESQSETLLNAATPFEPRTQPIAATPFEPRTKPIAATPFEPRTKLTAEMIGKHYGDRKTTVFRYIRLTYLIPPLLELVDQKKIGLGTGEQLSYLRPESQKLIFDYCYAGDPTRPLKEAHARTLREVQADPDRIIDEELLDELLAPKKKVRFRTLKIEMAKLREYFPPGTPEEVVVQTIQTALAAFFEGKEE